MRVVVAPDKFAGTLSAAQAADAVRRGWLAARPSDSVDCVPLSDGGPGFLQVLHQELGGRLVPHRVQGPLGGLVDAEVLLVDQGGHRRAYVESAQACGLALVGRPSSRTAFEATTAGVGDLLRAALHEEPDDIVVGVGGTASSDGGRGCVARFGGVAAWPAGVGLVVATDVDAPLLGPRGAVATFAAQKGAAPDTMRALEERLADWVWATNGPADTAGAGAGGGLGYGLLLLGAEVCSGIGTVLEAVRLARRLDGADLVITGEGRFDASSLAGKVPGGVAALARERGVACWVLAGDLGADLPDDRVLAGAGVTVVRHLVGAFGLPAASAHPADRLAELSERMAGSA